MVIGVRVDPVVEQQLDPVARQRGGPPPIAAPHPLIGITRYGRLGDSLSRSAAHRVSSPPAPTMAPLSEAHRDYALVPLGSRRPLYVICACRQEIHAANLRLWTSGLPVRYVPWHQR